MNKKKYIILGMIIISLIILVISIDCNKKEDVKLEEVVLTSSKKTGNSNLAIMVQKEDGSGYEKLDTFPSGLALNTRLSGCINKNGEEIDGAIEYNVETMSLKLKSKGSSYCYLYFIRDSEPPIVTVTISENNSLSPKLLITSNESGTYCLNTSSTRDDISNCLFSDNISKNETITTDSITASNTYYVHIKDAAGNIGVSTALPITKGYPLGQYIIDNSISGLQKTLIGTDTLYRFSGTSGNTGINNYICLGTTSCSSGSANMYRIIGVEPSTGNIKVIKQLAYDKVVWNSTSGVTFANSNMYKVMNTTYYNSLSFKDMIQSHTWNVGVVSSSSYTTNRSIVINYEDNSTITANVGIISLTDYYMAYNSDQNWNSTYSNYANNWIHIKNNTSDSYYQWTMTRSSSSVWALKYGDGQVYVASAMTSSVQARPTFFLKNTVLWKSGSGTSSDPFIVELAS